MLLILPSSMLGDEASIAINTVPDDQCSSSLNARWQTTSNMICSNVLFKGRFFGVIDELIESGFLA